MATYPDTAWRDELRKLLLEVGALGEAVASPGITIGVAWMTLALAPTADAWRLWQMATEVAVRPTSNLGLEGRYVPLYMYSTLALAYYLAGDAATYARFAELMRKELAAAPKAPPAPANVAR